MIYLVRQGETDWNLFKRCNGKTELPPAARIRPAFPLRSRGINIVQIFALLAQAR